MESELIPSPCISNCCLDEQDVCLGCFRTLKEIIRWGEADDQERRQIMELVQQRQQQ
jgi:predicted Fe-S protein YdhL (DUF1289 family)